MALRIAPPWSTSSKAAVAESDEIVLRLPVSLNPAEQRTQISLFQYPLRPRWRPYNLDELKTARVRPEQRRIELTLGMECSLRHHDVDSESPLTSIQLASTSTSMHPTSYAIGTLRTDEKGTPTLVSLTPLSSTVQLRPSFVQIDQQSGNVLAETSAKPTPTQQENGSAYPVLESTDIVEEDEDDDGTAMGEASIMPLAVPLLRPAQTEREIEARRSSHAFLVEEREKEPWSAAHLHSPGTPESLAMREHIFRP